MVAVTLPATLPVALPTLVGVLRHRLHNSPEIGGQRGHQAIGQRAGRRFAIAQQGFSHAGVLPSADIGVTVIHVEVASPTHATVILVIAKAHHRPADLAELPVVRCVPSLEELWLKPRIKGLMERLEKVKLPTCPLMVMLLVSPTLSSSHPHPASLAARIAAQVLEFSVALNRFTCTAQVLFAGAV